MKFERFKKKKNVIVFYSPLHPSGASPNNKINSSDDIETIRLWTEMDKKVPDLSANGRQRLAGPMADVFPVVCMIWTGQKQGCCGEAASEDAANTWPNTVGANTFSSKCRKHGWKLMEKINRPLTMLPLELVKDLVSYNSHGMCMEVETLQRWCCFYLLLTLFREITLIIN